MKKFTVIKLKPKPRGTLYMKVCILAEAAAGADDLHGFRNHFNYDLPKIRSGNNVHADIVYRLVIADDFKSATIQHSDVLGNWRDVIHVKPV